MIQYRLPYAFAITRSEVSKLVETCWQVEKWLKGLKRQKYFYGFADVHWVGLSNNMRIRRSNILRMWTYTRKLNT